MNWSSQSRGVCTAPVPCSLPGLGLNCMTTETGLQWKPEKEFGVCDPCHKTGRTSGNDNTCMDDNVKVVEMEEDP